MSLFTCAVYAQAPISNFYSVPSSVYATVNASPAIDQSASGANVTWSFMNLTTTESSTDTYVAPTAPELATYPGTTSVFVTTPNTSGSSTKVFGAQAGSAISLTGAEGEEFSLNYITDNASIGTFPLAYSSNNTDAVAGTFDFAGSSASASGTFTGNIVVTVDAHGTLNLNDVGAGAFSGLVTRLKTVQTVDLSVPPFSNIGTATQTSYYYYDDSNNNLVFRSNTVQIVVALFGINETTTINEVYLVTLLGLEENVYNEISVVPNPVQSILNVNLKSPTTINTIVISDINGRQVLSTTNNTSAIDVSGLQAGMYIVQVQTDRAVLTKKFIKK